MQIVKPYARLLDLPMRQVTIPLLREFQEKIPILYDDIEPNAKQSESMKRMR
jgi:hypothetical protein